MSKRRSSHDSILTKRSKLETLTAKSAPEPPTLPRLLGECIPLPELIRIILGYDVSELILTVGGWGNWNMETKIEVVRFDIRANSFLKIAESRLPSPLWGHALVLDDEKRILVIGGRTNDNKPTSRQIIQISMSPLGCILLPKTQYVGLHAMNSDSSPYAACAGTNYRDHRKNSCFVSMIEPAVIKQYTFHDGSERSIDLSRVAWAAKNNTVHAHKRGATLCVTDNLLWIYMETHHLACYDFSAQVPPVWDFVGIPGGLVVDQTDYVYLSYVQSLTSRRLLLSTGMSIYALNIETHMWTILVPNTGLSKMTPRYHSGPLICDSGVSMFYHEEGARGDCLKRFSMTTGAPLPIDDTKSILPRSRISSLTL